MARLGNVLYWTGCVFALIIVGCGVLGVALEPGNNNETWIVIMITAVFAAVVWVIGRACRYVLAGR